MAVELEVAVLQNLALTLERMIGELAVVGGDREIPQRVKQLLVNKYRVVALSLDGLSPLIRKSLRHDVLDRQGSGFPVHRLRVVIALFETTENEHPLRASTLEVERRRLHRLKQALV